jgi:hypothetical protein
MTDQLIPDECELMRQLRRSERIFELLTETAGSELQIQKQLRKEFPQDLVRGAMTLHKLRHKAVEKFSLAAEMWLDRKGLQQATSEPVARYKAKRFKGRVWDYCCGIGGNTIALAEKCEVFAVDQNPAACLRTAWNADVFGVKDNVQPICADVETLSSHDGLVHIDPDRRPNSHTRVVRVEECVPGLDYLKMLTREFRGGAIKLSPAGNFAGKFSDVEVELISLNGECKEAVIWFGELGEIDRWRATVLPSGASLSGDPMEAYPEFGTLQRYVSEPDGAIVRAGLIDLLAERLQMKRLDESEEYLTSNTLSDSPFVHTFEVLEELPNNDREIRGYFRNSDFGRVEIKCRHIPIDVESVRRKLPLPGDQPGVLIFVRVQGKARAVVCRRCD